MEAMIVGDEAACGMAGAPQVVNILVELREGDWRERRSFRVIETAPELMIAVLEKKIRAYLAESGRSRSFDWVVASESG